MKSAGARQEPVKSKSFKHMAQTPQVGGNAMNQTQKSHTSIGDDSNYDNDEFESMSISKSMGNIGLGLGAKHGSFATHAGAQKQQVSRKKSIGGAPSS